MSIKERERERKREYLERVGGIFDSHNEMLENGGGRETESESKIWEENKGQEQAGTEDGGEGRVGEKKGMEEEEE